MAKKTFFEKYRTQLILGAIAVVLVFLFTGIGGTDGSDDFVESTELQDDTLSKSEKTRTYETKSEDTSTLVDNDGSYNVTCDENDDCTLTNSTGSVVSNTTREAILDVIPLDEGDQVINLWRNSQFSIEGFDKLFEGALIQNSDGSYELFYRIENTRFYIGNLEKYTKSDMPTENRLNTDLPNGDFYVKGSVDNLEDIVSLAIVDTQNDLQIIREKDIIVEDQNCVTGVTDYTSSMRAFISNEGSQDVDLETCLQDQSTTSILFSVQDIESYSFPSVAVLDKTRTTGFERVSVVKQEGTNGIAPANNKQWKLLIGSDLRQTLEDNENRLTPFLRSRFESDLETEDLNHNFFANNQPYLLGEDTQGVVIENGYVEGQDIHNRTNPLYVEQIRFEDKGSRGLRIDDLGESSLSATQIQGFQFGNLKDMNVSTHGTANFINNTGWTSAGSILYNLITFDFSGVSQYWTDSATDPQLVDDFTTGDTGGDTYGFSSSYEESGGLNLGLTTEKPVSELLQFNNKNYWLFYTLENTETNGRGCLVFDMIEQDLNLRVPVSVCGQDIGGSNTLSQFKLTNGGEELS